MVARRVSTLDRFVFSLLRSKYKFPTTRLFAIQIPSVKEERQRDRHARVALSKIQL